jgi:hypothetical protein
MSLFALQQALTVHAEQRGINQQVAADLGSAVPQVDATWFFAGFPAGLPPRRRLQISAMNRLLPSSGSIRDR